MWQGTAGRTRHIGSEIHALYLKCMLKVNLFLAGAKLGMWLVSQVSEEGITCESRTGSS